MAEPALADLYRGYVDCLNRQDWPKLGAFVHDAVSHNGERVGLSGYRAMLERDFRVIPDLRFTIQLLVCDPPQVASRLAFDCSPNGTFLGLPMTGRRLRFTENVFYAFREGRIETVWSIIDKAAVEAQL